MKILLIILILFCIFSFNSNIQESNRVFEETRHNPIENEELEQKNELQIKIDKSIYHLQKIIARNEQRINNWEHDLIEVDSTDSLSLELYINEMKNRVKIQKDRLKRLKRKVD